MKTNELLSYDDLYEGMHVKLSQLSRIEDVFIGLENVHNRYCTANEIEGDILFYSLFLDSGTDDKMKNMKGDFHLYFKDISE